MKKVPKVEPEPEQPVRLSHKETYKKARRILLWGLPFLFGGILIYFAYPLLVIQNQEHAYQSMRQEGWTTYLQEYSAGGFSVRSGRQMAIDKSDRMVIAGGCHGLAGLHVFDGVEWIDHSGDYCDVDWGQQGEIWAVDIRGFIDVFDGQQKRTYTGSGLGLGEQEILQVEVDSNGRIWIVTRKHPTYQVAEIVIQQDRAIAEFSHPEFIFSDGWVESLDADNQGRIWAAVWRRDQSDGTGEWVGLNVFDGGTWHHLPDQGVDLTHVVRTAFDKQNDAWVATGCGGVMKYDGKAWVTIVEEDTVSCYYNIDTVRSENNTDIDGITLDNQGRPWIWNSRTVKFLRDGKWITLTEENSGFTGGVFGLVIDDEDRVWVGSAKGVSMATLSNAQQPLPENIVQRNRTVLSLKERTNNGMIWFIPSVIALLWIATYLNVLPGALLAVSLGLLSMLPDGPPMWDTYHYGRIIYINPGVAGTFCGVVGGIVGGLIDKKRSGRGGVSFAFILAIVGCIVGYGLMFFWNVIWTFMHG